MPGSAAARVRWTSVEGADELFTAAFLDYLAALHDRFLGWLTRSQGR